MVVAGRAEAVTDGMENALKKASAAAGDKAVGLMGADVSQQYLKAGLVDEIEIHVANVLLTAGRAANIPVIVGSCGTAGTDDGVDWVSCIVDKISEQERLQLRVARLYSEQDRDTMLAKLAAHQIMALEPAGPLDAATVVRCERTI